MPIQSSHIEGEAAAVSAPQDGGDDQHADPAPAMGPEMYQQCP